MAKCRQCGISFEITQSDLDFYDKVSPVYNNKKYQVPPPTLCPDCRQQRRIAIRNERMLYSRKCDLSGKDILSCYSADKPYKIYDSNEWYSDKWDALKYGKDFDFNRPFFEQFAELQNEVPRIALHVINNENSDYVNLSGYNKNCYLIFAAEYNEECLYGTQVIKSQNCVDTLNCLESNLCYEVVDCEKCHTLFFGQNCSNCNDGYFLYDCKGCSECIMCTNLRKKQYCYKNRQLNKDEYSNIKRSIKEKIQNGDIKSLLDEFTTFKQNSIHRAAEIINCENVSGDYLANSKNLTGCFDLSYGEDCRYVYTGFENKDMADICHTTEAEMGYEGTSFGYRAYNCIFTHGSWTSKNSHYCDIVKSCNHMFGCVCMNKREYCILNKQYEKQEYEELVPKIIEHMQSTGEWGEFFPVELSPFAYNETIAQDYFPLTKKEVLERGWKWRDEKDEMPDVEKIISADRLPDSIDDIPDDVLNWAIKCEITQRPFKIVKQELEFYRRMKLPVPHLHPDERHKRRMAQRNPRKLWKRKCEKCGVEIETTYAPDRPEKVYCEDCYLKEVY
ncbi:hypothetical protein KKF03_00925 [Patescibacteria group bacterium]|nr:hypothetical protein [Patescibacteria group bacterium]